MQAPSWWPRRRRLALYGGPLDGATTPAPDPAVDAVYVIRSWGRGAYRVEPGTLRAVYDQGMTAVLDRFAPWWG